MDRQNEGIEDATKLRLILLDMGGLLPQIERKQDWPSYRSRTFPLACHSDPRLAKILADLTPQDFRKFCLLSRKPNWISRILAVSGILGYFQKNIWGAFNLNVFVMIYKYSKQHLYGGFNVINMDNRIKLSKRNEKLLWVGSWTSKIGDKVFDYANSVFIVGMGGSASVILAFYQSSETRIGVFFNLLGGVVADGYSRKKICILTDILSGLTCFILTLFLKSETVGLYVVLANALLAVIHAFNSPTYKSIIKEVILKERIKEFNSIARGVTEIIRVVSPIVGLTLVKFTGVKGALLIDGCTFMLSAIIESFLKPLPGCENKPTDRKSTRLNSSH